MLKFNKIFIIFIIIIIIFIFKNNSEHFTPWNIGTRYIPLYDIRGSPFIYPWNYSPSPYFSSYFYDINGKYRINKKYANLLNKFYKDLLKLDNKHE
jgi:hypothetical protein